MFPTFASAGLTPPLKYPPWPSNASKGPYGKHAGLASSPPTAIAPLATPLSVCCARAAPLYPQFFRLADPIFADEFEDLDRTTRACAEQSPTIRRKRDANDALDMHLARVERDAHGYATLVLDVG